MAVNYCVAHMQKFKMWSVLAMEKHLNRTAGKPKNYDIDPKLTEWNVNLMDPQEKFNGFDFKGKYKNCLENNLDDYKVRKDAVAFFSVVVSASPDFFKDKTRDQVENYFEAAKDFLMNSFPYIEGAILFMIILSIFGLLPSFRISILSSSVISSTSISFNLLTQFASI